MERDQPRVFPRPDILIIRTAKLGGPYFYRSPPHDTSSTNLFVSQVQMSLALLFLSGMAQSALKWERYG